MTTREDVSQPSETCEDPYTAYKLARLHWKEAIGTFFWLIVALVAFVCFMLEDGTRLSNLGGLFFMLATVMFIYHCRAIAERKWDSPSLGCLGFLPVIGLLILVLLPGKKRRKDYYARRRKKLASWRSQS